MTHSLTHSLSDSLKARDASASKKSKTIELEFWQKRPALDGYLMDIWQGVKQCFHVIHPV